MMVTMRPELVAGAASMPPVFRVRGLELSQHSHRTDNVVGYVVRWTIAPGGGILTDPITGGVGRDVAWVAGGNQYAAALDAARAYRAGTGYAVVDSCWACGCRS